MKTAAGSQCAENRGSLPRSDELFDIANHSLLTAPEAAKILHISVKSIYKFAKTKRLPCVLFGKAVRFRPEDIWEVRQGRRNL